MTGIRRILLTFSVAFFVLSLNAQTIEFRFNGEKIEDGSTLEFSSRWDILSGWECAPVGLALVNLTSGLQQCDAVLTISENSMQARGLLCIGSMCESFSANDTRAQTSLTLMSNQVASMAMFHVSPATFGTMTSRLTVSAGGESHSINIVFRHEVTAAIGSAGADGSGLHDVYDLSGREVLHGVSPSDAVILPRGVYIFKPSGADAAL